MKPGLEYMLKSVLLLPASVEIPDQPMFSICWLNFSPSSGRLAWLIKKTGIILEFLLLVGLRLPLLPRFLFRIGPLSN
jgi:hypothetical protein